MRRSPVGLLEVADLDHLARAFHRAAQGKRLRPEVQAFAARLDSNLAELRREILAGTVEVGRAQGFCIHDPKPRQIHAPCFRERVLHHALMAVAGPVLDRALVDDTVACRKGKGSLAAVLRAQELARRNPCSVKADVRKYFDSIDHAVLLDQLARRFKSAGLLRLFERIVRAYEVAPGKGLPIGALTSQHFANHYLGPLDRFVAALPGVCGMVRYMDDVAWWCGSAAEARASLAAARAFACETLCVELKDDASIQPSRHGIAICGFRVLPHRLLLTRRRRRRYAAARRRWERAYARGQIDSTALQRGYSAALGITAHAESRCMRRAELRHRPELDA